MIIGYDLKGRELELSAVYEFTINNVIHEGILSYNNEEFSFTLCTGEDSYVLLKDVIESVEKKYTEQNIIDDDVLYEKWSKYM